MVDWVLYGMREIKVTYGDNANVKYKSVLKFGENAAVGTTQSTVMTLPAGETEETYVATNSIDKLSSSSTSDTDQTILVEGHTISGSDLTFVTQTASLNGQNKVTLTTPLARCTRAYVSGGSDLVGTVYVYQDGAITAGVPDTSSEVHLMMLPGENASFKAATAFSAVDYALISQVYAMIDEKTAATGILRLKTRVLNAPFRTIGEYGFSSNNALLRIFQPYIIIPPNSDVILTCEADGAGTDVSAGFDSILCLKET